jgi:AraC family transcriptional regulator
MQKDSFTIIGASRKFRYENAKEEIPKFWNEYFAAGNGKYICGMYGINLDADMTDDTFEYLIADNYNPAKEYPEGFVTRAIPAFTWAVFPCKGALPTSFQELNNKVFSEWLPANKEYEIASGCCVEMYDDPRNYPNGTLDENYYSEMWIPVRKKRNIPEQYKKKLIVRLSFCVIKKVSVLVVILLSRYVETNCFI